MLMRIFIVFLMVFSAFVNAPKADAWHGWSSSYRTITCGYISTLYFPNFSYDPAQASDTIVTGYFQVYERGQSTNASLNYVCTQAYDAKLYAWSQEGNASPTLGGLEYELIAPNGDNIAHANRPSGVPTRHHSVSVTDNNAQQIAVQLRFPAGQNISIGSHSSPLYWDRRYSQRRCRYRNRTYTNCGSYTLLNSYGARTVSFTVPETMSLNIAGSGVNKTMDFGALHTGDTQNINIQASATSSFQIEMTSEMGGSLKLNGDENSTSEISYTTSLDGTVINEATPYINTANTGTNGVNLSLPFIVTIGDMSNKRAGTYSDIITLKIKNVI